MLLPAWPLLCKQNTGCFTGGVFLRLVANAKCAQLLPATRFLCQDVLRACLTPATIMPALCSKIPDEACLDFPVDSCIFLICMFGMLAAGFLYSEMPILAGHGERACMPRDLKFGQLYQTLPFQVMSVLALPFTCAYQACNQPAQSPVFQQRPDSRDQRRIAVISPLGLA